VKVRSYAYTRLPMGSIVESGEKFIGLAKSSPSGLPEWPLQRMPLRNTLTRFDRTLVGTRVRGAAAPCAASAFCLEFRRKLGVTRSPTIMSIMDQVCDESFGAVFSFARHLGGTC
jgi:hypothetical protein